MGLISLLLAVLLIAFAMTYMLDDTTTTAEINTLEQRLNTEKTVDDMVSDAVSDDLKDILGQ
jgi:hypothetical protein